MVPSQVYALVGSEKKGQVLGGMVAAGAGRLILNFFLLFANYFCLLKLTLRNLVSI